MTMPRKQVINSDDFRPLAIFCAARPNAKAPPVCTSNAISEPKPPQTRINQPIVSSCITRSEVSAKLSNAPTGDNSNKPTMAPMTSARMGRFNQIAMASTTIGGIKLSALGAAAAASAAVATGSARLSTRVSADIIYYSQSYSGRPDKS